jgi:dihydrofolate reductase
MRTLVVTQSMTVDGSIELLGDWFQPQGQADTDQSDLIKELRRQDSTADAFVTGRRTFEDLRGYWRDLADDTTGISEYLNTVHKYVVSSTITDPQWQNSTVLSGDATREIGALKEQPGQDIVVTGSITLCHTLIKAGLVDEYRLFVYPAVQGRGRRLFPDGLELAKLTLLEAKSFRGGVTLSRYAASSTPTSPQ